jgi:hypothetical protein
LTYRAVYVLLIVYKGGYAMRITADVSSVIPGGINLKQSASALNRNVRLRKQPVPSSQNIQNSLHSRLQRERRLGDALSIAQMSHSVIQKAMNVTSRLRSIASQAFSGGSINRADINQAVSQIDNLIGEYGESVSVPAVTGSQGTGAGVTDVIENLKKTKESAAGMNRDNSYNTEVINSHLERLSEMEKASGNKIKVLKESMNKILAGYPAFNSADIASLSKSTVNVISGSPADAINSHNNIHTGRSRLNLYG